MFHFILYIFTISCEYDHRILIEIVLIHGFKMIEEDILGCCLVFVLVGRVGCALWLEESGQHSPGKTRCCFSSASYNIVSADTSYRHLTTCLYSHTRSAQSDSNQEQTFTLL